MDSAVEFMSFTNDGLDGFHTHEIIATGTSKHLNVFAEEKYYADWEHERKLVFLK